MISLTCPGSLDFLPDTFSLHVSYIFYFMMYLCISKYIIYIYIHIYIMFYIYIYMCVCVCVCKVLMLFHIQEVSF